MKIIINNIEFGYDIGCRILKLKYDTCPIKELEDIWEDIVPMTFKEIANQIKNLEQRRVAIGCLGIDNIVKEVRPILIDKKTIKKPLGLMTMGNLSIRSSMTLMNFMK
jgi:hypothetical protein